MPVRIGFISFAHGHTGTYADQLVHMPEVELVACWDDDVERGRECAERYHMRFVPNLDDMLGDGSIDTVIIGSPTNRHADHAIAAAKAGKNILLQKPMALSLADCDRIIEAVNAANIAFSMAYQMRCDPVNQWMREHIREGKLGKVGIARRRHCIPVLFNDGFVTGKTRWHIDPVQNMGMWMDDASHAMDWFYWMFGRPKSVIAEVDNVLTDVAPDDTGAAILRFTSSEWIADGMFGILLNSSVVHAGMNTTELYGDAGVLMQNFGDSPATSMDWPDNAKPVHWMRADQGDRTWRTPDLPLQRQGERIAQVPRPFIDALTKGAPVIATAEEGRVAVEMVLAAYESARTGRRISFPFCE